MSLFQAFGRRPRRVDQGAKAVANRGGREGGGIHTCLICAGHSAVTQVSSNILQLGVEERQASARRREGDEKYIQFNLCFVKTHLPSQATKM